MQRVHVARCKHLLGEATGPGPQDQYRSRDSIPAQVPKMSRSSRRRRTRVKNYPYIGQRQKPQISHMSSICHAYRFSLPYVAQTTQNAALTAYPFENNPELIANWVVRGVGWGDSLPIVVSHSQGYRCIFRIGNWPNSSCRTGETNCGCKGLNLKWRGSQY